jgi:hypothetical protein
MPKENILLEPHSQKFKMKNKFIHTKHGLKTELGSHICIGILWTEPNRASNNSVHLCTTAKVNENKAALEDSKFLWTPAKSVRIKKIKTVFPWGHSYECPEIWHPLSLIPQILKSPLGCQRGNYRQEGQRKRPAHCLSFLNYERMC